jgi:hypothetical protein
MRLAMERPFGESTLRVGDHPPRFGGSAGEGGFFGSAPKRAITASGLNRGELRLRGRAPADASLPEPGSLPAAKGGAK